MPLTQLSPILLCGVFTGLLLFAESRAISRLKWIAKPAASLCFVLLALACGAGESAYGIWILIGLVLCMAGDILLIPAGEKTFLAGMGAFAAGHAAGLAAEVAIAARGRASSGEKAWRTTAMRRPPS